MEQRTIDRLQQTWLERWVRGATLHVGSGSKPIHAAYNCDPNPAVWEYADIACHGQKLSFRDGTFDRVVSSHVFQLFADPRAVLQEMARILCWGGVMAHVVPDRRYAPDTTAWHHPFTIQRCGFFGPEEFAPLVATLPELRVVQLEEFSEFRWSFKVVLVKV
jgi:SAM-dependent methyltransferase